MLLKVSSSTSPLGHSCWKKKHSHLSSYLDIYCQSGYLKSDSHSVQPACWHLHVQQMFTSLSKGRSSYKHRRILCLKYLINILQGLEIIQSQMAKTAAQQSVWKERKKETFIEVCFVRQMVPSLLLNYNSSHSPVNNRIPEFISNWLYHAVLTQSLHAVQECGH